MSYHPEGLSTQSIDGAELGLFDLVTDGMLDRTTVGSDEGFGLGILDRVGTALGLSVANLDTPPPHAQHASLAVCPKFADWFPNKLHLSSAAYHVHV